MFDSWFNRLFAVAFVVLSVYAVYTTRSISALKSELVVAESSLVEANRQLGVMTEVVEVLTELNDANRRTAIIVDELNDQIEERPDAHEVIPADLAAVWRAGIKRLRDDAGYVEPSVRSGEPEADVQPPASAGGGDDRSEADAVLLRAGASDNGMRPATCGSNPNGGCV